ncbi:hypothetical protein HDA44_005576 [Kribbella solani]|uniref:Uncharacterized protein n=1 Tax=Kribbella solani TaxID=236067 RepID=A0A841DZP2_9ACTN|nr:hypothetical protein [Kribbella solani]
MIYDAREKISIPVAAGSLPKTKLRSDEADTSMTDE